MSLQARTTPKPYLDKLLAAKAGLAVLAFVIAAVAGASLPGSAIAVAVVLMASARSESRTALASVDLSLVLFFAGLFVVVRALGESGAIESAVGPWLAHMDGISASETATFAGSVVLGSNLFSNVPFVMVAVNWVPSFSDPAFTYVVLAVASTLAGNLTLFGSVANIIVFDSAGPRGEIGFFRFLRYGIVLTLATGLAAGSVLALARWFGA